jgi:hypothetical protein
MQKQYLELKIIGLDTGLRLSRGWKSAAPLLRLRLCAKFLYIFLFEVPNFVMSRSAAVPSLTTLSLPLPLTRPQRSLRYEMFYLGAAFVKLLQIFMLLCYNFSCFQCFMLFFMKILRYFNFCSRPPGSLCMRLRKN